MIPIGNPPLLRTAVSFDRCAYLIDLALGMSARIGPIGNEISDWTVGHGQPRGRFRCRYFVHAETPPKANDRRGFAPFENTIRSAQGEASAGRAEIDGKGNKRWCRYLSLCVIPIMVTSSKVANAWCCVS